MGRGDPDAVYGLLRHHDAGKIPLGAIGLQLLGIAFATVAEVEIVAADKAHSAELLQVCQKILPRSGHNFHCDRDGMDIFHALLLQQPLPVGICIDKSGTLGGKQRQRMTVKGDDRGLGAMGLGKGKALLQQRLMTQMDSVKKSQSKDALWRV